MSEHDQQAAVIDWFRHQYPKYTGSLFAIPNGTHIAGGLKARCAKINKLKREGFKNGVSDLFLALPKKGFSGMWIEMKDVGKNERSLSDEQVKHMQEMIENGYKAIWCPGAEVAINEIKNYLE